MIQKLPVELLALIFGHLHQSNHSPRPDLRSSSLFPCAIARVCQYWRDVISQEPRYWTRFSIDLAWEDPLILLDAFRWSQEHQFELLIFNSHSTASQEQKDKIDPEKERAAGHRISVALSSHIQRCTSLEFDVEFADSIFEMSSYIDRISKDLTTLRLDYRVDNADFLDRWECYMDIELPTKFPNLEHLSIDATTLIMMEKLFPGWFIALQASLEEDLTLEISHYEFDGIQPTRPGKPGECSISEFFGFIAALPSTYHLILRDFSTEPGLPSTYPSYTHTPKKTLSCPALTVSKLSKDFMYALFHELDIDGSEFSIFKNCRFPINTETLMHSEITLEDLPLDARPERLFKGWLGNILLVNSCPCFTDAFLNILGEVGTCEDCPAPYLTEIYIENCDNFSFRALKEFIQERNKLASTLDYIKAINSLFIKGRVPKLTEEEAAWFKEHVMVKFEGILQPAETCGARQQVDG